MEVILEKLREKRKLIERLLTIFVVVVLLLSTAVTMQSKFTFFATTRGISMQPVFVDNDLVLFVPYHLLKRFHRAEVGDIIVFRAPAVPPVWVHRIVDKSEPGVFRTKGDNNPRPDSFPVAEADILGVVPSWGSYALSIPALGGIIQKWQSSLVLRWGLPLLLLAVVLAMPSGNRRRLRRRVSVQGWLLRRLAIGLGCSMALFLIIAYPFLSKSGYTAVGYRVAEGEGIAIGGSAPISLGIIKHGDTRMEHHTVTNGGIIPMVALLQVMDDPLGEVQATPSTMILPPRTTSTIDIEVKAKEIGGWRQVPLAVTMAPYIMPTSWVASLSQIHPLMPNLVMSGGMSFLFGLLVFAILGRRRRRPPVHSRRQQRFPAKPVVAGASVSGLFVLGFLLPILLASTTLTLAASLETSVVTTSPECSTIAWRTQEIAIESETSRAVDLFWVDNSYALSLMTACGLIRNDGGILTSLTGTPWIEPCSTGVWQGTLDAQSLPQGGYLLEFHVRTFTQGGGLIAEWDVPVYIIVTPPPPPPEPSA